MAHGRMWRNSQARWSTRNISVGAPSDPKKEGKKGRPGQKKACRHSEKALIREDSLNVHAILLSEKISIDIPI